MLLQIKYVDDDSTLFWAVGPELGVLASRAEHCGKEVTMTLPLEHATGEVLSLALSLSLSLSFSLTHTLTSTIDLPNSSKGCYCP
jgi:hypothetical protein